MLEGYSYKLARYFIGKGKVDKKEEEIYAYGFEVLMSSVFSIICSLIIGVVLKKGVEAAIFLFVYCSIRKEAGGYHADTNIKCTLTFLSVFTFIMIVYEKVSRNTSDLVLITLILLSDLCIVLFAPVGTIENPIPIHREKKMKKKAILLASIYSIIFTYIMFFKEIYMDYAIIGTIAIIWLSILLISGKFKNYLARR